MIMLSLELAILVNGGSEPLSFFIPMIILSSPFLTIMAVNRLSLNGLIEKIPEFFNKYNISTNEILLYLFIIAFLFTGISVIVATKIYERREF